MRNKAASALLSAALAAAPAWAAPAVLELRGDATATELVIPGGDVRAEGLMLEPCSALLRLTAPDGVNLDAVRLGGQRIRSVVGAADGLLVVATECGAGIDLQRRGAEIVLAVGPVPVPARKPAGGFPAAVATGAPTPLVPRPPDPMPVADQAPVSPDDAAFARAAVADALHAAAVEATAADADTPLAAAAASYRPGAPSAADPAWATRSPLLPLVNWRVEPFRTEYGRLRAALADGRPTTRTDLARLLLAWGLGQEVLDLLPDDTITTVEDRALAAAATLLVRPDDPAADWFTTAQALAHADGPLWAASLAVRRGRAADGRLFLPAALPALVRLPVALRRGVALDLLEVAAASGLDGFSRQVARIVEGLEPGPADRARLHLLIGTLHDGAGRTDLALAQYDQAAGLPGPHAMSARMLAAERRHAAGTLPADGYRALLGEVLDARTGGPTEAAALIALAALEGEAGRPTRALDALRLLADRHPDHPGLPDQRVRATALLDALLGADAVPLADRIAAFEAARTLPLEGPEAWELQRRYAAVLASAGLTGRALAELTELAEIASLSPATAADLAPAILDLAALHLDRGAAGPALDLLDGPAPSDAADAVRHGRLKALALAGDGRGGEALTLLTGHDADTLIARARVLWRMERWREAATALEAAARQRPPTQEQAVMAALAHYLAGDRHAPARVLAAHAAVLEPGPWSARLRGLSASAELSPATDDAIRALLRDSDALTALKADAAPMVAR